MKRTQCATPQNDDLVNSSLEHKKRPQQRTALMMDKLIKQDISGSMLSKDSSCHSSCNEYNYSNTRTQQACHRTTTSVLSSGVCPNTVLLHVDSFGFLVGQCFGY